MKSLILLCAFMAVTASAGEILVVPGTTIEYRAISGLDGECPMNVVAGWHHVILTSHYRHAFPVGGEITWSSTDGIWISGPGLAHAASEGHPMGHSWVMDMTLAGECGEIPNPNRIFVDGFEGGDTSAWQ